MSGTGQWAVTAGSVASICDENAVALPPQANREQRRAAAATRFQRNTLAWRRSRWWGEAPPRGSRTASARQGARRGHSQGTPSRDRFSCGRVAAVSGTSLANVNEDRAFILGQDGHVFKAGGPLLLVALPAGGTSRSRGRYTTMKPARCVTWKASRRPDLDRHCIVLPSARWYLDASVSRIWTSEDDNRLRALVAKGASKARAGAALGRRNASVGNRARKLGCPFPPRRGAGRTMQAPKNCS